MIDKIPTNDGIVAITGASRGLGASLAVGLAKAGYFVACLSRRGVGVEKLEVPAALKDQMINIACDITDQDSISHSLALVAQHEGGLQCLINNAGIHLAGSSARFSNEDFDEVLQTNVIGTFAMCRAAYPYFKERGGGKIINIGSFYDRLGVPQNTAYAASKAALASVNRSLATEWARDHIAVVNIAPGYVDTDLAANYLDREDFQRYLARSVPIARSSTPEEVAAVIIQLMAGDMVLLTGQTIYVDGGHSIDHGRI